MKTKLSIPFQWSSLSIGTKYFGISLFRRTISGLPLICPSSSSHFVAPILPILASLSANSHQMVDSISLSLSLSLCLSLSLFGVLFIYFINVVENFINKTTKIQRCKKDYKKNSSIQTLSLLLRDPYLAYTTTTWLDSGVTGDTMKRLSVCCYPNINLRGGWFRLRQTFSI